MLALIGAVIGGIVLGGVIYAVQNAKNHGTSEQATERGAVEIKPASVKSFDPSGGSGFRDKDGTWTTQSYKTADFGGLKDGVGLLVDLGEPHEVTSVSLPSATPGLAVALLAGDQAPSGDVKGMDSADTATTKATDTTLSGADAGEHQYWMVWVTKLAQSEGGFSASIATPVVRGPAG